MPRLLPDLAAKETDRILSDLESRIKKEYKQALKEADAKWQKYMKSFEAADAKEAARFAEGEITKQQYQAWRLRHLAQGKQWEEMRNVLAHDYHNRNVIAAKLTNGTMPDVYAVNANYGTYLVEHGAKIDTAFTLYNHDTAEALLKEEWSVSPETGKNSFLPKPSEKKKRELAQAKQENPDVLWNKQKLQSVMMQGVLSGEPLTKLAERLAGVAEMDEHQAIRNARTMTTNVQSKGRMDAFDRAAGLGVELMDEWVAILDGATRHSHRHMHGERKPHDSKVPFSNGCIRPGDPSGPAAEVYNCRCRVIAWVKGFEGDTVKENPDMGGMSFEQWQNAKAPKKQDQKIKEPIMDFSGVDNATAEEYKKAIDKLLTEYPLQNHPIESVTDFRTAWGLSRDADIDDFMDEHNQWEGVGAIYYPNDTQYPGAKRLRGPHIVMYAAEEYTSSPLKELLESLADLRERNGWNGKQDSFFNLAIGKEGAMTHEYGHAIANDCGLYYGQKHYHELEGIFKKYTAEEIGRDISTYATTNPQEMMAEAFVAYQEPRMRTPIVNEIMELVFKRRGS